MLRRPARSAWLAAALSWVAGAGHLYAGSPGAAVRLACIDLLAAGAILVEFLLVPPPASFAPIAVYLAWRIHVAVAAFRLARADRAATPAPHGGRLLVALVAFVALRFVADAFTSDAIKSRVGQGFSVPSTAMEPTVLAGDRLVARPSTRDSVVRGGLCIFRTPDGVLVLKRLVAAAGDTIEMRGGTLIRNGARLPEPYAARDTTGGGIPMPELGWQRAVTLGVGDTASYAPTLNDWGPLVVPRGHFFVLGDNRVDSIDSRIYGFVADSAITHTPAWVYLSVDDTFGVRWNRIGHRLRE